MTAKFSTGLRNGMLNATGFKEAFTTGELRIFSGSAPADADAAETGTLLVTISKDGAGDPLGFGTPAAGVLSKNSGETWQGTIDSSGTATHWRLVNTADDGSASTTLARVQGTVAAAGADMNLTDPTLTATEVQPINFFAVALPTA